MGVLLVSLSGCGLRSPTEAKGDNVTTDMIGRPVEITCEWSSSVGEPVAEYVIAWLDPFWEGTFLKRRLEVTVDGKTNRYFASGLHLPLGASEGSHWRIRYFVALSDSQVEKVSEADDKGKVSSWFAVTWDGRSESDRTVSGRENPPVPGIRFVQFPQAQTQSVTDLSKMFEETRSADRRGSSTLMQNIGTAVVISEKDPNLFTSDHKPKIWRFSSADPDEDATNNTGEYELTVGDGAETSGRWSCDFGEGKSHEVTSGPVPTLDRLKSIPYLYFISKFLHTLEANPSSG